jgi:SAM-dependent methyltransferase
MQSYPASSWQSGMLGYGDTLKNFVSGYPDARILELGAGRRPSFQLGEMPSNVASYTVNDIDPAELALLPAGYDMACFDVSGDASNFRDRYDVVFSQFLGEHVPDGEAMHRNVFSVLRDGGVAFHLIPTLYALPFVVNKLMPETLTSKILNLVIDRTHHPKFPANYSMCYGIHGRMSRMFERIGYSKVEIRNFYGHFYYDKLPLVRNLHKGLAAIAARRNWTALSSYAYLIAYK